MVVVVVFFLTSDVNASPGFPENLQGLCTCSLLRTKITCSEISSLGLMSGIQTLDFYCLTGPTWLP